MEVELFEEHIGLLAFSARVSHMASARECLVADGPTPRFVVFFACLVYLLHPALLAACTALLALYLVIYLFVELLSGRSVELSVQNAEEAGEEFNCVVLPVAWELRISLLDQIFDWQGGTGCLLHLL